MFEQIKMIEFNQLLPFAGKRVFSTVVRRRCSIDEIQFIL